MKVMYMVFFIALSFTSYAKNYTGQSDFLKNHVFRNETIEYTIEDIDTSEYEDANEFYKFDCSSATDAPSFDFSVYLTGVDIAVRYTF